MQLDHTKLYGFKTLDAQTWQAMAQPESALAGGGQTGAKIGIIKVAAKVGETPAASLGQTIGHQLGSRIGGKIT